MMISADIHGVKKIELGTLHQLTGGESWVRDISVTVFPNPESKVETTVDITLYSVEKEDLQVLV